MEVCIYEGEHLNRAWSYVGASSLRFHRQGSNINKFQPYTCGMGTSYVKLHFRAAAPGISEASSPGASVFNLRL